MSILAKIFGGGVGEVVDKLAGAADRFITTDTERAQLRLEFEKVLQARDSETEQTLRAELGAQERILIAELQQDDHYTKRARPTVVYFGLGVIGFNYCLTPVIAWLVGTAPPAMNLPDEFWWAWGGVTGLYSWNRSQDKRNARGSAIDITTGKPMGAVSAVKSRLLGES